MILADRYHYPAEFHKNSLNTFETALNTAPAYASWQALDPGAGFSIDERYDAVPGLTKAMIRESFPSGLIPCGRDLNEGLSREEIGYTFTSGTTGDRVVNIWDQNWWDRAEAASWKLNSRTAALRYPLKTAKLASSLNVGVSCEDDLPMNHRVVDGKLYLNEKISLMQWLPRHFARMADELGSFRPVVLEANPSLLARLAYWAIDNGVEIYSPDIIFFTFEYTSKIHLATIRRAFTSTLISSFGTTETGFVLEECEAGMLHQNTKFCRIDFRPLKKEFGGPDLGGILVTTFDNPWNAVVKFDTGDLVRLRPEGRCACGRDEGMIAEAVEGRTGNATFTTDGGLVTTAGLDGALAGVAGLRDYQLTQTGVKRYELSLTYKKSDGRPPDGLSAANVESAALEALRRLYGGDGVFEIRFPNDIFPGPAGKFQRSKISFDYDWKGLFT